jgi:hypothetical protein
VVASVNEILLDEAVHHAVDTTGYSNWVVRRLIALLNRVDADLFGQLQSQLQDLTPENFSVQRLDGLLVSVRNLNRQLYDQIGRELTDDLKSLTQTELTYQADLFKAVLPVQINVASVNVEQVYAAAMARPMQGRLLSEWVSGLEANRAARIRDTLRMGYVENKTTAQIVREIRGTRAKGYSDGIIEIDRRHAESLVQTAISHTAGVARDNMLAANADLVKAVAWHSTLDNKTSQPCRIRDGLQYTLDTHKPIGHKIPWLGGPGRLHWRCRSTSSPVVKSWQELTGVNLSSFTPEQRASMDGAVPADLTYGDWLKKQSAQRQDEILGPARGKLLRDGGLEVAQFSNDKGKFLTLEQLRDRNTSAFRRASL